MLNDADSYQGGGSAGDEPREKLNDAEVLFSQLKRGESKATSIAKGH
jgi:hypothetical protein